YKLRRIIGAEDLSPRLLEPHDFPTLTTSHLSLAFAEESVDERCDLRSRFDEVADRRLHAATAGGGDHERHFVRRAENGAQQTLDVGRDLEEVRIEMTDNRLRHRLIDAGMNLARAGAIEQALGRVR